MGRMVLSQDDLTNTRKGAGRRPVRESVERGDAVRRGVPPASVQGGEKHAGENASGQKRKVFTVEMMGRKRGPAWHGRGYRPSTIS